MGRVFSAMTACCHCVHEPMILFSNEHRGLILIQREATISEIMAFLTENPLKMPTPQGQCQAVVTDPGELPRITR